MHCMQWNMTSNILMVKNLFHFQIYSSSWLQLEDNLPRAHPIPSCSCVLPKKCTPNEFSQKSWCPETILLVYFLDYNVLAHNRSVSSLLYGVSSLSMKVTFLSLTPVMVHVQILWIFIPLIIYLYYATSLWVMLSPIPSRLHCLTHSICSKWYTGIEQNEIWSKPQGNYKQCILFWKEQDNRIYSE